MSVRMWKRVIAICVMALVIFLISAVACIAVKTADMEEELKEIIDNEDILDLSEYVFMNENDLGNMFKYLGGLEVNRTLSYQGRYAELYVENNFIFEEKPDEKICYLTFDDGPDRDNTERILDVLKDYGAKATFFVVYKDYREERELYQRIVNEGHTIAVHTASHNYRKIYASVEDYLDDFWRCSQQIEAVTGVKPEIFRFPGGSVNSYNAGIYQEIIAEMTRRGYTYYDWNVSSGDAASSYVSPAKIIDNVLNNGKNLSKKIVLLHDGAGHGTTADAMPEIIEGLLEQGYKLEALTKDVKPVCFGYGD